MKEKKKKQLGKVIPPTDLSVEEALKKAFEGDQEESPKDNNGK